VVHPAPSVKEATVVDWLKEQNIRLSTLNGEERHGIVHRLDKGTTGALVVAKNNHAHQHLSKQLEERTMGRYYLAIVEAPFHEKRTVEAPIARHPKQRTKMAIVPTGREAKTEFVPIDVSTNGKYILLACKLYTGRTHQIRVHLQSINRPILGDNLYGFKSKNNKINRIMLHASLMYLNHPKNGTLLHIQAPIETDMNKFIKNEFSERIYEKILAEQLIHYFDTHTF
jgi:23S rRNA pseudouridine1911/1915/1917 synthase